jgi:hypothetical protein
VGAAPLGPASTQTLPTRSEDLQASGISLAAY